MRSSLSLLVAAVLLLFGPIAASAQTSGTSSSDQPPVIASNTLFPFSIPWNDAAPGVATDASFLNTDPAGKNGFIVVKHGHFVESRTGRRVRFFGVNMLGADAFVDHSDAEGIAAHLAKLGVNIVRIHQADWDQGPLFSQEAGKHGQFDPVALDKFDYLIYQLKLHGVYVDINLRAVRQYTIDDGFPASVADLSGSFDKRVDNFDSRMIALQKQYAQMLLAHVNPYTRTSYAQDPCVAIIEINNENSLVGQPWRDPTRFADRLPEPFKSELQGLWNDWLTRRYRTTTSLVKAWTPPSSGPVVNVLSPNSAWALETPEGDATLQETPASSSTTAPNAVIAIAKTDGVDWHIQTNLTGFELKNGQVYTLSMRIKADRALDASVYSGINEPDWRHTGLETDLHITPGWQSVQFPFTAKNVDPGHNRITFVLGGSIGTIFISDLKLESGSPISLSLAGQSLEQRNIGIPQKNAVRQQILDWVGFLIDTETDYADTMRGYLRSDLKVKANIVDTQMRDYGGVAGFVREAGSDFEDSHSYWQHPSFPGTHWDPVDWVVGNTPMVTDLAKGSIGTLEDLAVNRVFGKPYTISEYNHPAPSDYQAEMLPMLATFASLQDWDMICVFDYGAFGAAADTDKIQGFFEVGSNPAKAAFMPGAAEMFRSGEFAPAADRLTLRLTNASEHIPQTALTVWQAANGGKFPDDLTDQIGVIPNSRGRDRIEKSIRGDSTSSITVVSTSSGPQYLAVGDGAVAATGYLGGQKIALGPITITVPTFGNNFASLMITAMDGQPLTTSHRLLLTIIGKAENTGMIWNAERKSLRGRWGQDPSLAEGIPAEITVSDPNVSHVWALNGGGARSQPIAASGDGRDLAFTIGPADKTVWYEIGR